MLAQFIEWAHSLRSIEAAGNFRSTIAVSSISDNCSARLDIDTPRASGRITFWETGAYYAESIDLLDGEEIYSHYGALREGEPVSQNFSNFLLSLGIDPHEPRVEVDRRA